MALPILVIGIALISLTLIVTLRLLRAKSKENESLKTANINLKTILDETESGMEEGISD